MSLQHPTLDLIQNLVIAKHLHAVIASVCSSHLFRHRRSHTNIYNLGLALGYDNIIVTGSTNLFGPSSCSARCCLSSFQVS